MHARLFVVCDGVPGEGSGLGIPVVYAVAAVLAYDVVYYPVVVGSVYMHSGLGVAVDCVSGQGASACSQAVKAVSAVVIHLIIGQRKSVGL